MSNFKAKFNVLSQKTEDFFDCNHFLINHMYRWIPIIAIGTQITMAIYINTDESTSRCEIAQTVDRDGELTDIKLCKDLMEAIRKQQSK